MGVVVAEWMWTHTSIFLSSLLHPLPNPSMWGAAHAASPKRGPKHRSGEQGGVGGLSLQGPVRRSCYGKSHLPGAGGGVG